MTAASTRRQRVRGRARLAWLVALYARTVGRELITKEEDPEVADVVGMVVITTTPVADADGPHQAVGWSLQWDDHVLTAQQFADAVRHAADAVEQ